MFSGHNTICVATAVLEAGLVAMQEPETRLCLEAPGGLIQAPHTYLLRND
jgi:proline racemase